MAKANFISDPVSDESCAGRFLLSQFARSIRRHAFDRIMVLCERLTAHSEPLMVNRFEHVEEVAELRDTEAAQVHGPGLNLGQ
ncbi:hypothetical protein ASG32_25050 [Methylobacterium sp. Leaf361]|uniref:hypothetical protein n=1 Tax=Methylobacterium sp. Leaf361 TaxID=1736352 RepID=UPI0006FDE0FD|nr:hypothetical protein [Methylobacterium sp. Leaf361]KQS79731.1 hypothetical protein ASG32_25050 [Methylobacterium sp. Leaf361]